MAYVIPAGATHALMYRIHFSDDGEPEEGVLHVGTLEECEGTQANVPAVSYSGERRAVSAESCIVELEVRR